MPSATESALARSSGPRRAKLALIIAAIIILVPGLVMAILYYRHGKAEARKRQAAKPSPPSELTLSTARDLQATGDLTKAAEGFQQAIDHNPRDAQAYVGRATVYARVGQYGKAAELAREAVKLAPDSAEAYENLADDYLGLQHPEDAHEIIREALARKLDAPAFHEALYTIAFLAPLGPIKPAMADQLQWFARRPSYESYGLALASDTAAYSGQLAQSREYTQRAVDSAVKQDDKLAAALWQEHAAIREAAFGNMSDARRLAEAGIRLAPANANVQVQAALALALAANAARAQSLAAQAEKAAPHDTQIQSLWLTTIRAQLALQQKDATAALNDIGPALPLELGQIPSASNLSCLYPTYVRGVAYLAADQGMAAANEFQKILDHSDIVGNCWTGALAHLGLARANIVASQQIDTDDVDDARLRAVMAYKEFLKLWKNADADIPVLKQAQKELANLQQ